MVSKNYLYINQKVNRLNKKRKAYLYKSKLSLKRNNRIKSNINLINSYLIEDKIFNIMAHKIIKM